MQDTFDSIYQKSCNNYKFVNLMDYITNESIARCMYLMNRSKLHYVVDIDIKGFFDNVNHSKLKKQLWKLGIRDKNLLSILGKILKSEIEGIGIPERGTPQGGIISPILAYVMLSLGAGLYLVLRKRK